MLTAPLGGLATAEMYPCALRRKRGCSPSVLAVELTLSRPTVEAPYLFWLLHTHPSDAVAVDPISRRHLDP